MRPQEIPMLNNAALETLYQAQRKLYDFNAAAFDCKETETLLLNHEFITTVDRIKKEKTSRRDLQYICESLIMINTLATVTAEAALRREEHNRITRFENLDSTQIELIDERTSKAHEKLINAQYRFMLQTHSESRYLSSASSREISDVSAKLMCALAIMSLSLPLLLPVILPAIIYSNTLLATVASIMLTTPLLFGIGGMVYAFAYEKPAHLEELQSSMYDFSMKFFKNAPRDRGRAVTNESIATSRQFCGN